MADARFIMLLTAPSLLLLAGCSGQSNTTLAGMLGTPQSTASIAPPVVDATARALQVGATSARASRCGFYFDPGKLRAQFLAAETKQGTSPEVLQKAEREYDYTRASVAQSTAGDPNYCTDEKAAQIKVDLNRHLAGDFTPPAKKPGSDTGLMTAISDWANGKPEEPFNPGFDDITGKPKSVRQ